MSHRRSRSVTSPSFRESLNSSIWSPTTHSIPSPSLRLRTTSSDKGYSSYISSPQKFSPTHTSEVINSQRPIYNVFSHTQQPPTIYHRPTSPSAFPVPLSPPLSSPSSHSSLHLTGQITQSRHSPSFIIGRSSPGGSLKDLVGINHGVIDRNRSNVEEEYYRRLEPEVVYVPVPQVQYVDKVQYVEVPKYVEKFVEVEKIVKVPEIQYVEKIVEVPKVVEKVVEVPTIIERVVEVLKEPQLPKCFGCMKDIHGPVHHADGKDWHRDCYVTCIECGSWIPGDAIIVDGKKWHRHCFVPCGSCGRHISGPAVEVGGRPWHQSCCITCAGCKNNIIGEYLTAEGQRWHHGCYTICAGCHNRIEGRAYEALDKLWHEQCFLCNLCDKSCSSSWVLFEGKPCHPDCAEQPRSLGMAVRQTIQVHSLEEAEKLDRLDGIIDGKFKGTAILCPDPEWQRRWGQVSAWEVSDERMAHTLAETGQATNSRVVVSQDGELDGIL